MLARRTVRLGAEAELRHEELEEVTAVRVAERVELVEDDDAEVVEALLVRPDRHLDQRSMHIFAINSKI